MPDNWIDKGESFHRETGFEKFLKWLKNNRDTAVGSLVILIAIVVLTSYFIMKYSQTKQIAWQEMFKARQQTYVGKITEARKTIRNIEKGFSKTDAAAYALLLNGDIYYRQGKYKEAIKEYEKAGEKTKNEELLPIVQYDIGKSKEAEKDFSGAEKVYEKFLTSFPEHFLAPEIHHSLARIYEITNKPTRAKEAYEKIAVLYPQTAWARVAKNKLMPQKGK